MTFDELVRRGHVFATFDQQDSGCTSYGIDVDGHRLFVKVPTTSAAIESLERARAVHGSVRHPALVAPTRDVTTTCGTGLVYPWCDGEVLYDASARSRFRRLPFDEVVDAATVIVDAHVAVAAAGFVAVDLYDGCFLYDFAHRQMRLIDVDEYRRGAFLNEVGRLPGSTRFMAPEEHTLDAMIDERTTVFHLGRTIAVLLAAGDDTAWRGSDEQWQVVERATVAEPDLRYADVRSFAAAWSAVTRRTSSGDRPPPDR